MKNNLEQNIKDKKSSKRKYIIAAFVIFLCIFAGLTYRAMTWEPKPDPESERVIRRFAAEQLNKDPNELTDTDFAKITTFSFSEINANGAPVLTNKEITDIKLLGKFINLQDLTLGVVHLPVNRIPEWMKVLAKFGVYDLEEKYALDLSPLDKLNQLENVTMIGTSIRDIKPLAGLTNLKRLRLMDTKVNDLVPLRNLTTLEELDIKQSPVSNLEPIKNMTNLKFLDIQGTKVSNLEPIANLTNLRNFSIGNTNISNVEPIKNLTNMRFLILNNVPVSSLEPIKGFINLQQLVIRNCINITDEQITELQKALPNLEIDR